MVIQRCFSYRLAYLYFGGRGILDYYLHRHIMSFCSSHFLPVPEDHSSLYYILAQALLFFLFRKLIEDEFLQTMEPQRRRSCF